MNLDHVEMAFIREDCIHFTVQLFESSLNCVWMKLITSNAEEVVPCGRETGICFTDYCIREPSEIAFVKLVTSYCILVYIFKK